MLTTETIDNYIEAPFEIRLSRSKRVCLAHGEMTNTGGVVVGSD